MREEVKEDVLRSACDKTRVECVSEGASGDIPFRKRDTTFNLNMMPFSAYSAMDIFLFLSLGPLSLSSIFHISKATGREGCVAELILGASVEGKRVKQKRG